jgi:hypothetical protein
VLFRDGLAGPEVVEVEDALDLAFEIDYDERGDFFCFHEGEGVGGECAAVDGDGTGVHDLAGGVVEGSIAVALEKAAEVAVGDHAQEFFFLENGGHAEFFAGHLVDDLRHWSFGDDLWESFGGVHEVAYAGEADAEAAAGVEVGEVGGVEAMAATEFEGEGVSEGEHDGGGGGGSEIEWAGLGGDADVEEYVR